MSALVVLAGLSALLMARAKEPPPLLTPAISEDAGAAIAQMDKTLSVPERSFTARTIRVYLEEAGQPLHVFHTMKVVMRHTAQIEIEVTGDDRSHEHAGRGMPSPTVG